MSHGDGLFTSREGTNSRPSFELALRGYDKRQVDHFVSQMDGERESLVAERDRLHGLVRNMSAQMEQMHQELTELRHAVGSKRCRCGRDLPDVAGAGQGGR